METPGAGCRPVFVRLAALFLVSALFAPATAAEDIPAAAAAFERQDYATALTAYEPAAREGNAQAQYRMGMMYRFGWGVDKDFRVAREWFEQSAGQGHAEAQSELGKIFKDGRGTDRDPVRAAHWFEKAAMQGLGVAQLNLGRMYRSGQGVAEDAVRAHAWFTMAIDAEYMDAIGHRARLAQTMSEEQKSQAKALAEELRTRIGPGR